MKLTNLKLAVLSAVCFATTPIHALTISAMSPVDSGIFINAGTYSISASGTWSIGAPNYYTTATGDDANGVATLSLFDEFFAGAQKGGLVAYVGASAPLRVKASADAAGYYAILDGSQIIDFTQSGELWFTINDDAVSGNFYDNAGALDVSVTAIQSHEIVPSVPDSPSVIPVAFLAALVGAHGLRTIIKAKVKV